MMRFQRESSDYFPSTTSKKSSTRTPIFKENNHGQNGRTILNHHTSNPSNLDEKRFRFRSPSRSQDHHINGDSSPGASPSRVTGDVLLQWGQRKRARVPRVVLAAAGDNSSASTAPPVPPPQPPPLPPPPSASNARVGNLRRESSGILPNRNLEHRPSGSGRGASRSVAGRRSPQAAEKGDGKMTAKEEKTRGNGGNTRTRSESASAQTELEDVTNNTTVERANVEVIEWPKIYIALSRKEKEDDFLAMKGTKLPQRPKKRAKYIDRSLQYCFPGMWLSELTRSRYEVREKKCVKKQKRRGLKGMESMMDSDSE